MSLAATTLSFQLRGEWLSATRKTAQAALASGDADNLDPCVDGFLENAASLGRAWDSFRDLLRGIGLPTDSVRETIDALRPPLETARQLLEELHQNSPHRRADLERARLILQRVENNLAAFAPILQPMPPDLERIQRGLDEAARDEGDDTADLLRRYLQTGRL
jgi:hypothetical protein